MSEKSSAVSLRALVVAVAGPQQTSDNRKSLLARAARRAGISFRSVKAVFYSEIDDPQHHAVRLLRYALERDAKEKAEARKEAVENFRLLLAMRDALVAQDQAFNQPQIDALEYTLGQMVGGDFSGAVHRDRG